jgi:putative membrane protein
MSPLVALALAQPTPIPEFSWWVWSGDGVLRGGLLLLAGVYLLGIGPLRRRFRLGPPVSRGKVVLYLSGVVVLWLSLDGPLHELSDTYLFSGHMVQHMLVIYAAPPLMLLGMPGWLLQPVLRIPGVFSFARQITRPLPALILFNVVFVLYHIPDYYNAIQEDHNLHIAAHLVFIALAVITWWPILSPMSELPRLPYPIQMLYVFGQTLSGFLVGSFVTNAQTILYPFYVAAPRLWGLSPMDDQKIGGLIMWVFGGFYLLLVYTTIFFVWARAENVHDDVAQPVRRRPRVAPPVERAASPVLATAPADGAALTTAVSESDLAPRRMPGSPKNLGARHAVTSAPDPSRLN